jgi:hydroxyacylglutathione hydrolase
MEIQTYVLGPLENNTYLLADPNNGEAAVVDPSFGSRAIAEEAARHGWKIGQIWLTHAHFDHLAGVSELVNALSGPVRVGLHPADLALYYERGGADQFGISIPPGPEPVLFFSHGLVLKLGKASLEVRHVPGHTPGHVVFFAAVEKALLCGDVIFRGSIGRTDLPGGDFDTLITGIRTQVLTLPEDTRLLSGHGPESTVRIEKETNPFL